MKIESTSITEISNKMFYPMKTWAEASAGNWNMLLCLGLLLLAVGGVMAFVFRKKMGKADERTTQISLKSALMMLCVIVFFDVVFPKDYMWEIFFLYKYALAIIASGIYLAVRYRKDFS